MFSLLDVAIAQLDVGDVQSIRSWIALSLSYAAWRSGNRQTNVSDEADVVDAPGAQALSHKAGCALEDNSPKDGPRTRAKVRSRPYIFWDIIVCKPQNSYLLPRKSFMDADEKDTSIRAYANSEVSWRSLQDRGFSNYLEVLAGLGKSDCARRPPR